MSRQPNLGGPRTSQINSKARPLSHGENEKDMWSSMLDSVASGKNVPEKNLIVLGGTPDTQKEFLDTLTSDAPKRPQDRHNRKPVVANEFALGYTYQDVLDADHEDILARLSIYLLWEPSPSFAPLLNPLFTPRSIPESLLVILLDWNEPWLWVRQLRDWILLLRETTSSLDNASTENMEEIMKEWQQRRRGVSTYDSGGTGAGSEANITLPLSQGEWDEPLGLPLCVVCQNSDNINALEMDQNWMEEEFDFVLQFLRTILLKHGASLIYTSTSNPNSLPTLIHSTLGIHSLLKKQALKHNVIDKDKVLVPPNWDSWGKIMVLREGFDVEGTSSGWSTDTQQSSSQAANGHAKSSSNIAQKPPAPIPENAVLPIYEIVIPNPLKARNPKPSDKSARIEISTPSTQAFLASQLDTLDRLKAEEEISNLTPKDALPSSSTSERPLYPFSSMTSASNDHVNEQIGPVQVNMGGIQVDADDMLRKLKNREATAKSSDSETSTGPLPAAGTPDMKAQNEALNSFFANLVKRGASNSPKNQTPSQRGASRESRESS